MIPVTPAITQFSTVGGAGDGAFDDVREIGGWPNGLAIDPIAPITAITVRSGFIIDKLLITYSNGGQGDHGGSGGGETNITLTDGQILVGVSGRAGYHPRYKRDYLIKVSFVVFDTQKETTTIYGPYGGGDSQYPDAGTAFYIPRPLAFAGNVYDKGQTGIAGLCMVRKV